MVFLMGCPKDVLQYMQPDREIIELSKIDLMEPELRDFSKRMMPMAFDAVKVLEAQPTLPYKFPYSYDSPNTIQCNSIPKLPDGVTLHMIKTQYNKVAEKLGLDIPFPEAAKQAEVEYNYTMLYIILLLLLVVVVAVIYAASRRSKPANQNKPGEYYY